MRMYTETFNSARDLNDFVRNSDIQQDQIVTIFQANNGLFILMYYAE